MLMHEVQLIIGPTRMQLLLRDNGKRFYGRMWDFCNKVCTTYQWNPRFRKMSLDKKYYRFDRDEGIFYFHIAFKKDLEEVFAVQNIRPQITYEDEYVSRSIAGELNPDFVVRDYQEKAIDYINDGNTARKGLSLQTGKGKTFTATAAALQRGKATLIVASGLTKQWIEAISEQTIIIKNLGVEEEYNALLNEEIKLDKFIPRSNQMVGSDIFIIQGIKSLRDLISSKVRPKFIFASLETLRSYIKGGGNYEELMPYMKFLKHYGIGTRIVDESHKHFHSNVMTDLSGNIPLNIYLTATFDTPNKSLKKIFDKIYPSHMHYGADLYDKYVNATFYGFCGSVPEKRCSSQQGYTHSGYEQWLLKHDNLRGDWYNRVIMPLIHQHWTNT